MSAKQPALTRDEKLRILRAPLPFQFNVIPGKTWSGSSDRYSSPNVHLIRHRMSGSDEQLTTGYRKEE